MALTIFAFLCGVLLSFRFPVLVLAPAILLGWIVALAGGLFAGNSGASILLELILVGAAAQTGYMAGVVGTWIVAAPPVVTVPRQRTA